MSYFSHAFKKSFVATKPTQVSNPGVMAGVTEGILSDPGVHVSELKNQMAPYQLGPGVTGFFDPRTNESTTLASIGHDCCPFYIASAAIKLNDKQGPFHGGYQESNKSKIINPKYLRKLWKVNGNAASRAVLEIGGTVANNTLGAVLTLDMFTLVPGTGYVNANNVPTTASGAGTGLTVDITTTAGAVTGITINQHGIGYVVGEVITINAGNVDATVNVLTVDTDNDCDKEFLCGESYYLRIDVKGTSSLRFAHHNLYRTFQAYGGCCVDPAAPVAVDPSMIYLQWCQAVANDPYLNQFVRPVLVVDNMSYFQSAEVAVQEGFPPLATFDNAPTTSTSAGMILLGAYFDTVFQNCTFQVTDYYQIEPIQLYASETDLNGDPCAFETLCVSRRCEGMQANGLGEQKVRDLILSESYLQNFVATDLRIREITQGTAAYTVLDRALIYSSFFILHSVPRYNNPTGTFDNDQYLLEIVGTDGTTAYLEQEFSYLYPCIPCGNVEDFSGGDCTYPLPGGMIP